MERITKPSPPFADMLFFFSCISYCPLIINKCNRMGCLLNAEYLSLRHQRRYTAEQRTRGEQKADVIERIMTWDSAGKLHVSPSDHGYPAGMIRPVDGQLIWFLDDGAASKLPSNADACRSCANDR